MLARKSFIGTSYCSERRHEDWVNERGVADHARKVERMAADASQDLWIILITISKPCLRRARGAAMPSGC